MNDHLAGSDKFLVDILIKPGNRIYIFIDGDHGVTIADCVELSRCIESNLDRESEDFELNVSSSGADQPIRLPRQYLKNTGRSLQVKLSDDKTVTGKLNEVSENGIVIEIKEDKKKKISAQILHIDFSQILESKVILSFK
ncbi:MAG: ribosome assembly cofactor RimP [Bacteroidales bacterium]|nr:ribosome assembly cofactor RimP [Bacteroidales bacterium]